MGSEENICDICGEERADLSSVNRHKWLIHDIPSARFKSVFGCPIEYCKYSNKLEYNVRLHIHSDGHRGEEIQDPYVISVAKIPGAD